MLDRNIQEATDINNAFIQQANGNINNYGSFYFVVKATSQGEIAKLAKEAIDRFKKLCDEFERLLFEKVNNNSQVEGELKTPHMQIILQNTMKEYAQSEDSKTREELIDLLIERLKVNENNEKLLIEDAIKILPTLTEEQGNFLASLFLLNQFRIMFSPLRKSFFLSFFFWMMNAFLIISSLFSLLLFEYNFPHNIEENIRSLLADFLPISLQFSILFLLILCCLIIINSFFMRNKHDSFIDFCEKTEILHPYVLMERNNSYDFDHLKQLHCCADDRKKKIFEQFIRAYETYCILHRRKMLLLYPFFNFYNIKKIYDKQIIISNIRLTPVGEYIGKRIFVKITKQQ